MKQKIRLYDYNFGDQASSSLCHESKFIEWCRGDQECDIEVYTDQNIVKGAKSNNHKVKIAWLLEPHCVMGNAYLAAINNRSQFKYVVTHNRSLCEKYHNFVYAPSCMCWIKPEDIRIYDKSQSISAIVSNKTSTYLQMYRRSLTVAANEKISLFGKAYKPVENKITALADYRFPVAIENSIISGYFTEKLIDCFVTGTIPIYLGDPSISKIFDINGIICLTGNIEKDFKIINDVSHEADSLYNTMFPSVRKNFEIAQKYLVAEDWIYENTDIFNAAVSDAGRMLGK